VSVQREHELGPAALGHQRLAGTNGLVMAAHGQHRRHPVLGHRLAQLVEPGSLRAGERPVGELDERRPSPQRERLIEPSDGDSKVTALGGATSLPGQRLGLPDVDEPVEQVAGRAGDDARPAAAVEPPAQPQDVVLQRLRRDARWSAVPQRVDQLVLGDHRSGVHAQHGEQAAFLGPDRRHGAIAPGHFDRAEEAQSHRHPIRVTASAPRVQQPERIQPSLPKGLAGPA
jgi:hypothetical protein